MALTIGSVTFHDALGVTHDDVSTTIDVGGIPIATFDKDSSDSDFFSYLTVANNALMAYDRNLKVEK